MAKDKNVISLDERRRTGGGRAHRPRTGRSGPPAGGAPPERPAVSGSGAPGSDPAPGELIWLYCPTCRTLEYTELAMAGGRIHNACGTQVQEMPVALDLRAEATIAHINLERLDILQGLLDGQRRRFEEYLQRLDLAAGRAVEPYAVSEDSVEGLPVADVDAFGLLVSRFFENPAQHFQEPAGEPPPESPAPGASDD